jgi:hypothetical protein
MTKDESVMLVEKHQDSLRLTPGQYKRWAGKRFLVLIEVQIGPRLDEPDIQRYEDKYGRA